MRHHILLSILRHNEEHDHQAGDDEEAAPDEKSNREEEMLERFDGCDGLLLRSIQSEDCRANDAKDTADPALGYQIQRLQEIEDSRAKSLLCKAY